MAVLAESRLQPIYVEIGSQLRFSYLSGMSKAVFGGILSCLGINGSTFCEPSRSTGGRQCRMADDGREGRDTHEPIAVDQQASC